MAPDCARARNANFPEIGVRFTFRLLLLDFPGGDDALPLGDLALDERAHLLRGACARLADVTASARSLPAWTWPMESVIASSSRSTRPPSTSVSGLAPPRNGTCTISMPAMAFSSSPERWWTVPIPEEGKLSLPGFVF